MLAEYEASARSSAAEIRTLSNSVAILSPHKHNNYGGPT